MYQEYNLNDKKLLSELSDLIKGFTANGIEMLIRMLKSKESLKTDLATNLLFRQTLEMGDAIQELIKVGCVNPSKPLLRSLLEFYFQLAYLLKDNEERKALQFLYHYQIRQKDYYIKLTFLKTDGSFFIKL